MLRAYDCVYMRNSLHALADPRSSLYCPPQSGSCFYTKRFCCLPITCQWGTFQDFSWPLCCIGQYWLTYLPKFTIPCLPHTLQNSCSLCLFLTTIRCPFMVLPRPSILVLPSLLVLPSSIFVPLSHSSSFNWAILFGFMPVCWWVLKSFRPVFQNATLYVKRFDVGITGAPQTSMLLIVLLFPGLLNSSNHTPSRLVPPSSHQSHNRRSWCSPSSHI